MGIKYELAEDIQSQVNELSKMLFPHVRLDSVVCIRSHGSSSRGTIARCHALGKAMQIALRRKGFYVIEVISKRYDRMSEVDRTKTLIHELMHIPKTFGGGFIHHDVVHERNVNRVYEHYINLKKMNGNNNLESYPEREEPIKRIEIKKDAQFFVNSVDDLNLRIEKSKKKFWW